LPFTVVACVEQALESGSGRRRHAAPGGAPYGLGVSDTGTTAYSDEAIVMTQQWVWEIPWTALADATSGISFTTLVQVYKVLAPVCEWFTGGFDKPDLVEAKELLDELA